MRILLKKQMIIRYNKIDHLQLITKQQMRQIPMQVMSLQ